MVLAGEVMPSRHLTPFSEPDYLAAIELIRAGDVRSPIWNRRAIT